ncbi:MAG: Na(+)-translocating NADH-quinone reductase subunit A [Bacteroidaceae bacterium]|nr:Na(+)-translocating NADH-quinone reductase subunit A [Bacteroidaceae bacterium]
MANVIKLCKGLDINLQGKAAEKFVDVKPSEIYGLVPDGFYGMKPKVVVREGDEVKAGDALFVNKAHPEVNFVSPVSGKVVAVERGDRRKVLSVQVAADAKQVFKDFGKKDPAKMSAEEVMKVLLEGGMFGFFRQRPYDVCANPEDKPKAIFVSAFSDMPLAADFDFVLKGQEADFQMGIDALAKVAKVYLGVKPGADNALANAKNAQVNVFDGPCPAGNVGVQINHVAPINKGEVVWTIGPEEVIFIGRLFNKGQVDFTRIIAIAGSQVNEPAYARVKVGQKLESILDGKLKKAERHQRIIDGNPFVGTKVSTNDFLRAHTTEVTVIPEGDDVDEAFGWIMPRLNEFSTSRSYLSWLQPKKAYNLDARIKGGERHIIMSGEYDKVLPMDIFGEFLIKAIISGDIDRMEQLGIYEVAPEDFAVAEFIDSSKLELQRIVREGLDMLRKENE